MPETGSGRLSFAVDTTAHTGNSYRYVAQRIQQVTLGSRRLEVASSPALPVETAYRDVFPPPVPTGLVSAADTAAKAIDLDWTPDVDPGLAGYIIYRRAAGIESAARAHLCRRQAGDNFILERHQRHARPALRLLGQRHRYLRKREPALRRD